MKKVFLLLCLFIPFLAGAQDKSSAGFGLDPSDARAVASMRARMEQIRKKRPTVALVLSGGGAKGAATVGALKYLEQYKFPVDMVVGTSIGGLIGGVYSIGFILSFPFFYSVDDYRNQLSEDVRYDNQADGRLHLAAEEKNSGWMTTQSLLSSLPSGFIFGQNVQDLISSLTPGYADSTDFFRNPVPLHSSAVSQNDD